MRKLFAALTILFLTGCAAIPTGLDVKSGPEIAAFEQQEVAYYTPSGPVPGASAREIVSGFLAAGTGPQNDYSVAREFLSQDFAQQWKPDNQVLIRSGAPTFREGGIGLQLVSLDVQARLDEHGRYTSYSKADTTSLRFKLVQEDGQWRIDSAPNLTVVTPPVFQVVFKPYNVYFLDSRGTELVPDLRWFPSRTSTGTRLVNALLAGPSEYLTLGVQSAIPEGTKLTIGAVTIQQGVAEVDFDSIALMADAIDRRLMLSQLRATLLQLSGVSDVVLSVNSSRQDIIPAGISPQRSGTEVVSLRDAVYRLGSTDPLPISGTANLVALSKPTMVAAARSGNLLAFSSPNGVEIMFGSGIGVQSERVSATAQLASLEFDGEDLLWEIPKQSGSAVRVFDGSTQIASLVLPVIGTRLAAALSPEGSRLAVIVRTESETRLEVFTINRDVRNLPASINPGTIVQTSLVDPISLTWQTPVTLRILETNGQGRSSLSDYPLFGPKLQLPAPLVPGSKVVAGQSTGSSYLLGQNGELWNLAGGSWRRVASDVLDIAKIR